MSMFEYVLKDHVFIDFGTEIAFSSDQKHVGYPCRFITVRFQLMSTALLSEIADRIRIAKGYKPMHPMDEYTDETCDQNGWYDFYYGVNDLTEERGDASIEFVVVSDGAEDNGEIYTIDLSQEERAAMYNRMDEQCRKYLGKSCMDLLAEDRRRMEEDMS